MLVVRDIVQAARDEHPQFTRDRHPQRVCLTLLSERHRTYYKELADTLADRLSVAREIATVLAGALVGVDENGVEFVITTEETGYAVAESDHGPVYYVLPTPISLDPFGADGTPGFPLPLDALQILAIWAEFTSGEKAPIQWLPVSAQGKATPQGLVATVTQFRLSPVRNPQDSQSLWDDVVAITTAYVPEPDEFNELAVETLAQEIAIPSIYGHVLKWELCAFLARREKALDADFADGLLKFYGDELTRERARAAQGAIADHRAIKVHRSTRNR